MTSLQKTYYCPFALLRYQMSQGVRDLITDVHRFWGKTLGVFRLLWENCDHRDGRWVLDGIATSKVPGRIRGVYSLAKG